LRVTLSQNHLRARPPSAAMFDKLDMNRSFEFYRDRFADASDFTFFLVGSFDLEGVRPLVEQYLASLPGLGRVEQGRDRGIRPPTGVIRKTVLRGVEPRAMTQIVFTGPLEFERAQVLALQALADALRLRMRESLREELGGTYGVDVRSSVAREPTGQYQLSLAFGADPERLEELTGVLFNELEALKVDGPSATDLAKIREMQFRAREIDLRQNYFWITQLMIYTQFGWDPGQIPGLASRMASVTPEMIRDAARRYIDTSNYVQVSLLPEVDTRQSEAAPEPPG
jgi:zinc protease